MENFDIEKISNGGRKLFYEHKKALAIGFGVGVCLKYLTQRLNLYFLLGNLFLIGLYRKSFHNIL